MSGLLMLVLLWLILAYVMYRSFDRFDNMSWKHRGTVGHAILPCLQEALKASTSLRICDLVGIQKYLRYVSCKMSNVHSTNVLANRINQIKYRQFLIRRILQVKKKTVNNMNFPARYPQKIKKRLFFSSFFS